MAIDNSILQPMITPFEGMYQQCLAQGLEGEHVDTMAGILDRMKALGEEHSDIMAFMGQLTQENLQADFSDHYGKALAAQAQQATQSSAAGGYDDGALLKQTLDALRSAVNSHKSSYAQMLEEGSDVQEEIEVLHNPEAIVAPILELIALGETPEMTYPRFLREQIERGLDKAMEGAPLQHAAYSEAVTSAKVASLSPYHIAIREEQLALFEKLSAENAFGCPNSKELSMGNNSIERKYSKRIAEWEDIVHRWGSINGGILSDLDTWARSYCAPAPYWEPWSQAGSVAAATAATLKTQATSPGIIAEKLRLLKKYHGLDFSDVLRHPSFKWEVENHRIDWSQEYTTYLVEQVLPACIPLSELPANIVAMQEQLEDKSTPNTKWNPEGLKPALAQRDYYNERFGAGRYEQRFGAIDEGSPRDATPWNWATFGHGQ